MIAGDFNGRFIFLSVQVMASAWATMLQMGADGCVVIDHGDENESRVEWSGWEGRPTRRE